MCGLWVGTVEKAVLQKIFSNPLTGGRVDNCLVAMFRKFGGLLVYLAKAFLSGGMWALNNPGSWVNPLPVFLGPIKSLCLFLSHRFIFLIKFYTHVHGLVLYCRLPPTLSFQLYPVHIDGRRWVKRG